MPKPLAAVLVSLLASMSSLPAEAADGTRGAFTVTAVTATDASGCASGDGSITLTFDAADFGTAPYDVSTDNGTTYALTGATLDASNQLTVPNLDWGTYAIAVRDATGELVYPGYGRVRGCETFACSPLADEFHIDPVAGATGYVWSTDIGSIASGQNTTSVKLDLAAEVPNSVGELCVQPTGPTCTAPPTCFELRVRCPEICGNGIDDDLDGDVDCADGECAQPTVAIATAPAADVCAGQAVTFQSDDAGTGHTYAWTFGPGASSASATGPGPHAITFTGGPGAVSITAEVTVTDTGSGCTASDTYTGTMRPAPSFSVTAANDPTACGGADGSIEVAVGVPAGYDFEVSLDGGTSFEPCGQTLFTGLNANSYPLAVRYCDDLCDYAQTTETLSDPTPPTASISTAPATDVCAGQAATYEAADAGPGHTYAWNFGPGASPATAGGRGPHAVTYTGAAATTISASVTVTNTASGCSASDSYSGTMRPAPSFSVTASNDPSTCGGSDGSIEVSVSVPTGYDFEVSTDGGTTFRPCGQTVLGGLAAGTHVLVVRYCDDLCGYTQGTETLSDPTPPTATISTAPAPDVCAGQPTSFEAADAGAGHTYAWTFGPGASPATATGRGPHAVTYTNASLTAIAADLNVTNTASGCASGDTYSGTLRPVPTFTVVNTTNPSTCSGSDGSIEVSVTVPATYDFEVSLDGGGSFEPCGQTSFTGLVAASYPLVVRYCDDLCSYTQSTETLSDPTGPSGTLTGPTQVCAGGSGTFEVTGGQASQTYAWTFGPGASPATATGAGPHTVSFTAVGPADVRVDMDNFGCTSFEQQTVQVTALPTPSIAVTENSGPVADDGRVCSGYATTLVASGGVTYSWSTGETTARIDPAPTTTTTYSVTATDAAGCSAQTDVTVVVEDAEDPSFTSTPPAQTFACDAPRPLPVVTATDACGGSAPTITLDSTVTDICGDGYEIVRVWTATDDSGNTSTISQLVTVQDTQAPTFTGVPLDVAIGCSDAFPADLPTVTDNCTLDVVLVERAEIEPGACADTYVHIRVFVATDNCGNTTEARQRVAISDTQGPLFAKVPEDIELACGEAIPSSTVMATDACDVNVDIKVSEIEETNATGCKARPAVRRIWTAMDNCGNVSTASQLITFRDDEAPTLVDVPRVTTLDCDEPLDFAPPSTLDNCDPDVVVAYEDVVTEANCGLDIVRTWIATDACGNQTREDQEIHVRDLTPPVFTTSVSDVSIACGEPLPQVTPSGVDACDPTPVLTYDEFEAPPSSGCASDKQIYRQWTLTDACGNLATLQQIVTVTDRAGPVFSDVPPSMDAACATYDPSAEQPSVTDGCGGAVSVEERSTESQRTRGGEVLTVKLRTWTATDACGNSSTATQELVYAPSSSTVVARTLSGLLASGAKTCAGELLTLTAPAGADQYRWSTGETTRAIRVRATRSLNFTVDYRNSAPGGCDGQASYALRVGSIPCATTSTTDVCRLTSVETRTLCNDNGTPGDLTDDTYAVFATLRGTPGIFGQTTFRIGGDANVVSAFLNAEVKVGEFPYTRQSVSLDVVSQLDPTCARRGIVVASPGACGSSCELRVLAVEAGECSEGQFDLAVRVAFANPAGALRVNGKRFVLTGQVGEQVLLLPKLSCTGDPDLPLELAFEGLTSCSASALYDAACPDEVCLPVTIELGAP